MFEIPSGPLGLFLFFLFLIFSGGCLPHFLPGHLSCDCIPLAPVGTITPGWYWAQVLLHTVTFTSVV